jgi:hypothetical protein
MGSCQEVFAFDPYFLQERRSPNGRRRRRAEIWKSEHRRKYIF